MILIVLSFEMLLKQQCCDKVKVVEFGTLVFVLINVCFVYFLVTYLCLVFISTHFKQTLRQRRFHRLVLTHTYVTFGGLLAADFRTPGRQMIVVVCVPLNDVK